jgi:ATP-dependent Lhr-like helicase
MDGLLADSGLHWIGCGKEKIAFCFGADIELFLEGRTAEEGLDLVFPAPGGRYSFWDLLDYSAEAARKAGGKPKTSAELAATLWELAWKGSISTDSFQTVRRGMQTGFRAEENARGETTRRRGFDRWQASRPVSGRWFRIDRGPQSRDALDEEEVTRDRVRQVLQRYGVVFREILEIELPPLRWSRLFRSLRMMEFSGEVVTGRFFEGVPGVQFALPTIVEDLSAAVTDDVWWINAADPASLCGIDIAGLKSSLPARLPTTHVVFQGSTVVLVSRRRGIELEFRVPPDSPRIGEYLDFIKTLTAREQRPFSAVRVERINGQPVAASPDRIRLLEYGFVEDFRRLTWRARV